MAPWTITPENGPEIRDALADVGRSRRVPGTARACHLGETAGSETTFTALLARFGQALETWGTWSTSAPIKRAFERREARRHPCADLSPARQTQPPKAATVRTLQERCAPRYDASLCSTSTANPRRPRGHPARCPVAFFLTGPSKARRRPAIARRTSCSSSSSSTLRWTRACGPRATSRRTRPSVVFPALPAQPGAGSRLQLDQGQTGSG